MKTTIGFMLAYFVMGGLLGFLVGVGVATPSQPIPDCREAVVFVTDMQTTFALPAKLCGSDLYLDIKGAAK